MKPYTLLLSGLAALSLAAPLLAQGSAGTPPLTPNSNTNAPLPQVLHLSGNDPVQGRIATDKTRYRRGQPVHIRFSVVNTSKKAVTYNFPTSQKYDLTIKDAQGLEVWNWAKSRVFSQNLTAVTLPPGKPVVYTILWNGADQAGRNVKSGVYTLTARLTSQNHPAVTGGVVVNTDRDPNNMGVPTQIPADTGAVRQIDTPPPVSVSKMITIR
ncbi:MAG: BsuPI-related putative proteinase inhibitor [Armatimonadota bacterium]|nr:BsuPI-related putative proteinase inhibitor [Armatimonadota bacterium]